MHRSSAAKKRNAAPQRYLSGKTNLYLTAFHNYGYLLPAAGISQHFFEPFGVFINIDIDRPFAVGLTSLNAKRSGIRSVNDYFIYHVSSPE